MFPDGAGRVVGRRFPRAPLRYSHAVSNIYTEFVRFQLLPGTSMSPGEAEALIRRAEGDRGSYWVPVWYDLSTPGRLDLQIGSGKGAGVFSLEPEDFARFDRVWVRFADAGATCDVISTWSPALGEDEDARYDERRPCRYGFDAVHVVARDRRAAERALPPGLPWQEDPEGWRLVCAGSHLALNTRQDMESGACTRLGDDGPRTPGGLATPTTPSHGDAGVSAIEPAALEALATEGDAAIARVDLLHAGRVVHRAGWGRPAWSEHERWECCAADDWDNCCDEDFVRDMGQRG